LKAPGFAVLKSVRIISILALVLPVARQSSAQSASQRSRLFQGLFGPSETEQQRPRRLDVNWALYNAVDDNSFLATGNDIVDSALQARQWYTGATVSMLYTRRPPRSALTVSASSAARYYPEVHRVVSMRHDAGMSLDTQPARDWRILLSDSVSYSPFYQVVLGLSGGAIASPDARPPADDSSVSKQQAMQYGSSTTVSHTYSSRAILDLSYGMHYTQVLGGADSYSQRAGVLFTQPLSKDIGLRLGYGYGVSATGTGQAPPIRNNDLDVGVNYGRSFSTSTRTSFGFTTGSTIISSAEGRHFQVTGSGRLTRRLSPKWTARLVYDRGLQVPDGATRALFSDTVGASVSGYFSPRISLRVQPSYSHGNVELSDQSNTFNSFTSVTRLEVAMGRQLAFYAEHFYYEYRFVSGVGLPALLPPGVNRQGARVGVSLWTPLVP
jgi:hypothetical protein